ncbi:hypothetical protein KYY02_31185 [Streptomyces pimonensis]|uniref:Uncharacterized protein n=1 Tax=Streptomyces pimonensis TaxID=2860288 RepID=A0ABV4JAU7_9ACTN
MSSSLHRRVDRLLRERRARSGARVDLRAEERHGTRLWGDAGGPRCYRRTTEEGSELTTVDADGAPGTTYVLVGLDLEALV